MAYNFPHALHAAGSGKPKNNSLKKNSSDTEIDLKILIFIEFLIQKLLRPLWYSYALDGSGYGKMKINFKQQFQKRLKSNEKH